MAEEQSLGVQLPGALKRLLLASRQVNLANFQIGLANVFFHEPYAGTKGPSDGMICIADYFLEADGDQVLLDPRDFPADDPPVNYYAHSVPEVRLLARSFSGWLESLTRSPLFRE